MRYLSKGGVIKPENWSRVNSRPYMEHESGYKIHIDTYEEAMKERKVLVEYFGKGAVSKVDEWIGGMRI